MSLKSMTGFARTQWQAPDEQWQCEIKSVNGRNLDLRVRTPDGYDFLEPLIRAEMSKTIRRGSVHVTITKTTSKTDQIEINTALLQRFVQLKNDMGDTFAQAPMQFESILSIPGIVQFKTPITADAQGQGQEIWKNLIQPTIANLEKMRATEGQNLRTVLTAQMNEIAKLVTNAESRLQPQSQAVKTRLQDQLAAIAGGSVKIDEQRVAQELAMLAVKIDVREELDRLKSHIKSALELLNATDAVGRKLDFLAQEFNRETNTLCAKSADIPLTGIGLELKNIIDQFREQVQNIE